MRIYGVTISKMSEELFGNQPVFPEYYQKNISDGNADNAEHCVRNVGGYSVSEESTHIRCSAHSLSMPLP